MTFNQLIKLLPKVVNFCRKVLLVSVSGIWILCLFYVSECVEPGRN
jgi:hypothetical protein